MNSSLLCILVVFLLFAGCKKQGDSPSSSTSSNAPVITGFDPAQGGNGITVTIHGKNLGTYLPQVTVFFNGISSSPKQVNDTSIIVNVPQNATTGKISVTVSGQTAKSATDFVILPGTWVKINPISDMAGRFGSYGFVIKGSGYVGGGGIGGTPNLYTDFIRYDTLQKIWLNDARPPINPVYGVGMSIDNKGYMGIGRVQDGSVKNTAQFWEFNQNTDQWTRKADFPGATRIEAVGFSAGGKCYVGLGLTDSLDKNGSPTAGADWWEYDPAQDKWTRKQNAPVPMQGATGFVLNNVIYTGVTTKATHLYAYNPATDTWTQKSVFPGTNPFGLTGFAINGKGYLMGAGCGCWHYDASTDTWKQQAFFANYRTQSVGFSIGNNGYCGGGNDFNAIAYPDFWVFTPGN